MEKGGIGGGYNFFLGLIMENAEIGDRDNFFWSYYEKHRNWSIATAFSGS